MGMNKTHGIGNTKEVEIDINLDNHEKRVEKLLRFPIPKYVSNQNNIIIDELKKEIINAKREYKEHLEKINQKRMEEKFLTYLDNLSKLKREYIMESSGYFKGKLQPCQRSFRQFIGSQKVDNVQTCDLRKYDYYIKLSELW